MALDLSSLGHRAGGGAFGRASRFYDSSASRTPVETPGPVYSLPSTFAEHVQSPIYKGGKGEQLPSAIDTSLPHPNKDRTAWMIGATKNEMAFYSDIAESLGPAFYAPNFQVTRPASPRNVFGKNKRFGAMTQLVSKDADTANLCSASPGPQYFPRCALIDLTKGRPPLYSFGGRGMLHRSSFLTSAVNSGYLYTARPATSDPNIDISPASYTPRISAVQSSAPKPVWSKADRFADVNVRFISRRHVRSKIGVNSPGPSYFPRNYDMAVSKPKANVSKGKWCP